jgi:hypothetical protein
MNTRIPWLRSAGPLPALTRALPLLDSLGDLAERGAQQLLGGKEVPQRRRPWIAAVVQVEIAALVEFDLNGVQAVVSCEAPDGPATSSGRNAYSSLVSQSDHRMSWLTASGPASSAG